MEKLKELVIDDITGFAESIFRVRNNMGGLVDYIMVEPHKQLLRTGILGDGSARFRVINKGRQIGFSIFQAVESIMIAKMFPHTNQYYIATKEAKAKEWLEKVEQISNDSRVLIDGSRIIDMDTTKSSVIRKVFKHASPDVKKALGYSYITGLAASPRERGMTGLNVILDEFDHMNKEKDMQRKIWTALKPVLSQKGSQCTIQSTPLSKTGEFWQLYINAKRKKFKSYYFPCIENHENIDLSLPLTEQELVMPYSWIDIDELERERLDDVDCFRQERLGVPVDALHRFIPPELLYSASLSSMIREANNNGDKFRVAIDVASEVDITAVVVGQNINGINYERNLFSTSGDYPKQAQEIIKFLERYGKHNLSSVRIDNTGVGKPLADYLKRYGFRIERVNFSTKILENKNNVAVEYNKIDSTRIGVYMAEQFKRSLEDKTYLCLDPDEPCQFIRQANNHTLNVEQLETPTREKRYSGKKNGRDDFFWARAMFNTDFGQKANSGFMSQKGNMNGLTRKRIMSVPTKQHNILVKRKYAGW